MNKRVTPILILLLFLTFACNLTNPSQLNVAPPQSSASFNLVTIDPNATITPTPFQPVAATQTSAVTLDPTATMVPATPTPAAQESPVAITITPQGQAPMIKLPDGVVTILFFGSDFRAATGGYRTDTIILATINPNDGTVSLITFPRDMWVNLPNYGMQRINTSQELGGFKMTQDTFVYNFGIKPDYYVLTTFSGFSSVIDYLGGVDVYAAQNLSDRCDFVRTKWCSVGPGLVHMNSTMALWYIRARHTTNDIDRGRRAIEVLEAIFTKLMSLNGIAKAPQLYAQFRNAFDTDMTLADIVTLLPILPKLTDPSRIRHISIGYTLVQDWVTPDGAMVLVPNLPAIRDTIQKTITGQ